MKPRPAGFTLVELLVTVVIIAALGATGFAGYRSMRGKARMVTEINAARNLAAAYLGHAADHSGRLLAGYQSDPRTTNLNGETLHDPVNARYPWRLAPSVPKIEGVMLFNGNERQLDEENRDYLVSVHPNLGINAVYVGGHYGSGSPLRPSERLVASLGKYYISRVSESVMPDKLIVFCSARHDQGPGGVGNFEVRAPNILAPEWSSAPFSEGAPPSDHGFVDLRWGGRAVAAMLGGNVELLGESELRDMRRWSNQAARLDLPDFMVSPP